MTKQRAQYESGTDNRILEIKTISGAKKNIEIDLIKEQLKMNQNLFDQMNKIILALTE
jgi:hypothetical protein